MVEIGFYFQPKANNPTKKIYFLFTKYQIVEIRRISDLLKECHFVRDIENFAYYVFIKGRSSKYDRYIDIGILDHRGYINEYWKNSEKMKIIIIEC